MIETHQAPQAQKARMGDTHQHMLIVHIAHLTSTPFCTRTGSSRKTSRAVGRKISELILNLQSYTER